MTETKYKELYISLLEAEELPETYTGVWEEDKKDFIEVSKILETITENTTIDIDEEEQEEDFD